MQSIISFSMMFIPDCLLAAVTLQIPPFWTTQGYLILSCSLNLYYVYLCFPICLLCLLSLCVPYVVLPICLNNLNFTFKNC